VKIKKLKRLLEILNVNLTSIRWKLTSCFPKSKINDEKLLPMRKEWVEKYVVCKKKKKSSKLEFKDKLKEAKTTKQC